jgi:hypothetical protein
MAANQQASTQQGSSVGGALNGVLLATGNALKNVGNAAGNFAANLGSAVNGNVRIFLANCFNYDLTPAIEPAAEPGREHQQQIPKFCSERPEIVLELFVMRFG